MIDTVNNAVYHATMSQTSWSETHPFLNFEVDLRRVPLEVMLLLGEAKSKIEHIGNAPILPEVQREMLMLYLAKGIHATTAIEGNTLSEAQVRAIIEKKSSLPKSMQYQGQEVQNVLDACNEMIISGLSRSMTEQEITDYNRKILSGLETEEHVLPGQYRTYGVTAGRYRAPDWNHVAPLMREFVNWMDSFPVTALGEDRKIHLAVLKSIYAHLFFVWIHPFGDGNGRSARLIELRILLSNGIPTPISHLLSNYYNATRDLYYRRLDEARQNPWRFVEYALQGFVDGLAEQISRIQSQQRLVLWGHLVRTTIQGDSSTASRRRTVARALADVGSPVRQSEISSLSVDLAGKYAGKTMRTVNRDVAELIARGLAREVDGKVEANWDQIIGLLPYKVPTS